MVVLNKTFTKHVMQKAISDIFNATANVDNANNGKSLSTEARNDDIICTDVLATGSKILSSLSVNKSGPNNELYQDKKDTNYSNPGYLLSKSTFKTELLNFKIVTSKFLKTFDKIQAKIWNESIQESAFYVPTNYITCFVGLLRTQDHFMGLKKLIDRMIFEGILDQEDAIKDNDIMDLTELTKNTTIMNQDTTAQSVTLRLTKTMNIVPNVYTDETDLPAPTEEELYLKDKELYLLYTPHLPNYSTITNDTTNQFQPISDSRKVAESLSNWLNIGGYNYWDDVNNKRVRKIYSFYDISKYPSGNRVSVENYPYPLYRPFSFFKPKVHADGHKSKWNDSLPMFSHLIWRVGTPDQREEAIQKGLPNWRIPDVIVDHVDRISHIDAFEMTVKFDKVIF